MRWRNGEHGYGAITKVLHWAVFLVMTAQFVVGYSMAVDSSGRGRGRGRGRSGESGRGRGRGRGGDFDVFGDDALFTVHVVLGLTILVLATVRLIWRLTTPLPPWAPTLSPAERRLAHWVERLLYACMFGVPLSGLALLAVGDGLVWVHIATHLAFFGVLAVHLGLVLKHQFIARDHLVRRML